MSTENPTADPMGEVLGAATELLATTRELVTSVQESQREMVETIRALRPVAPPESDDDSNADPDMLPGGRVSPTDTMRDRFDHLGYSRGDFELAMMIMDGAGHIKNPVRITPSEVFKRAWAHHVFELPKKDPYKYGSRIFIEDDKGNLRAMDTAESGNGQQLVGAQYESDLWEAARAGDPLLSLIREIPMRFPTDYIPVDGALPELRLLAESTTDSATAYTASDTPSNRATLSAKKFGINQLWSGELNEDSIIQYTPFLRQQLNRAAIHGLASSIYNGDTTNAATGNINLDDADPADTKHYLAYDGIRHYWLVDATGQGKDMAGALDPKEIDRARGKLNGTTDDVDADFNNINWGSNANDLVLVCDFDTYMNLQDLDEVRTVDKYGSNATVITGELGRVRGIRVVSPAYASKTEADGKASDTEANNTKGQITVFNPNGFIRGSLRGLSLYFDRVQRTDQFLFELYMRKAFTRFGGNVAAGIYNITV